MSPKNGRRVVVVSRHVTKFSRAQRKLFNSAVRFVSGYGRPVFSLVSAEQFGEHAEASRQLLTVERFMHCKFGHQQTVTVVVKSRNHGDAFTAQYDLRRSHRKGEQWISNVEVKVYRPGPWEKALFDAVNELPQGKDAPHPVMDSSTSP